MDPCGYLFQSLDAAQQNYEIYDRELLEIICALEEWQHYLEGNLFPVHILSDHKNLEYFHTYSTEAQQKTSTMESLPFTIRSPTPARSWD